MKKVIKMWTSLFLIIALLLCCIPLGGCSNSKSENTVYIITSTEDYRIEHLEKELKENFPDYNCIVEYKDTGSIAAKIKTEGTGTQADIVFSLEYSYLSQLANENLLADLSGYDTSVYTDDVIESKNYLPDVRNGGAIIINPQVLKERGLEVPKSYQDLLDPKYKSLISMPNPKSSGTGYMFLKALVNSMGEKEAFEYFDKLSENILAFTTSGSGPVNALKNKEVAIGLGMTAQAVTAINEGAELEIIFFEEGSPFSMYGQTIVKGKESRQCVKEVFDYLVNTYNKASNETFFPEQIFKNFTPTIENYPQNIKYTDMSGNTNEERARLLEKWAY